MPFGPLRVQELLCVEDDGVGDGFSFFGGTFSWVGKEALKKGLHRLVDWTFGVRLCYAVLPKGMVHLTRVEMEQLGVYKKTQTVFSHLS